MQFSNDLRGICRLMLQILTDFIQKGLPGFDEMTWDNPGSRSVVADATMKKSLSGRQDMEKSGIRVVTRKSFRKDEWPGNLTTLQLFLFLLEVNIRFNTWVLKSVLFLKNLR